MLGNPRLSLQMPIAWRTKKFVTCGIRGVPLHGDTDFDRCGGTLKREAKSTATIKNSKPQFTKNVKCFFKKRFGAC